MDKSFNSIIQERKSIRNFSERKVSSKLIKEIILSCIKGPSAGGMSSFTVTHFQTKEIKQKLAEASYGQKFLEEAQVVFVFSALPKVCKEVYKERGSLYTIQDATIACTYAMLSAQSKGLSSCWVGAFDGNKVVEATKISKANMPVALLAVGYKGKKKKKEVKEDNLTALQEANLSPGYRKFRRMFKCKCAKCGGKACAVSMYFPKKRFGFIRRYSEIRWGFKCIKCGNTWWHAYDLKTFDMEWSKREKGTKKGGI